MYNVAFYNVLYNLFSTLKDSLNTSVYVRSGSRSIQGHQVIMAKSDIIYFHNAKGNLLIP